MMKKYMRFLTAVSAVAMILNPCALLPVHAEHVQKIVILGDSIATGKSLAKDEKSYVDLLEEYTNIHVQNFAQDTYTTGDILSCMQTAQVQQALAQADVICINAGEHDIMDGFLLTADSFMKEFAFEKFTDVFQANLPDYGFTDENDLIPYANEMASAIRANQKTAGENILLINQELEKYPDAKIIYQTAYNMLDTLDFIDTLSAKRKSAYNGILNPAKTTLKTYLNDNITQFAQEHESCILIDTCTGFSGNAWQYTNLYDLELNPTASGHAWIADTIIKEANLSRTGDVNADTSVNASDAANVLQHAANIGAGGNGLFNDDELKGADVDGDGTVNSRDASQILIYAAWEGSGKHYFFLKADESELADPDPTQPTDTELADPDPTQPTDTELADPDPTQPTDTELADPDPTQPTDTELADPDPTQPTDTELADPDPTQPTDTELADPDPVQPV
ncbi:MAG: hypothetical protein E7496_01325 [Ruminococcus sp.]|nr:hypothetical protein [Ruminococcus sp.]